MKKTTANKKILRPTKKRKDHQQKKVMINKTYPWKISV